MLLVVIYLIRTDQRGKGGGGGGGGGEPMRTLHIKNAILPIHGVVG